MAQNNITMEVTVKVRSSIFMMRFIQYYVNACNWLTLKKCKLLGRNPIQLTIEVYYPDGGHPMNIDDAIGETDMCEDIA